MALYQLNGISHAYSQNFSLSNITLTIEPLQIITIVGANGAGKTSLLNILAFINLPTTGELYYNDMLLTPRCLSAFRKTIAYVQQNPYLMRGTVYDNIALGLKLKRVAKQERRRRINNIMTLLKLSAFADRSARLLSGGEMQKIAIAQALVLAPSVLILDEPFSHLDNTTRQELEELLLTLRDQYQQTIIFTTHNQQQAHYLSDHSYHMLHGRLFKTSLINLFSGSQTDDKCYFNTGKLQLAIPVMPAKIDTIAIDPRQITLANRKPDTSIANRYCGSVAEIHASTSKVVVKVIAGEEFQIITTEEKLVELRLKIGQQVWLQFNDSAIQTF